MTTYKKSRKSILPLLLLGLFTGIGLFLALHQHESSARVAGTNYPAAAGESNNSPQVFSAETVVLSKEAQRIAALTKTMQRARDIGFNLNAPMEFYGRVVDQYGKPVRGLNAKISYYYYNDVVVATYEPHRGEESRVTDENGEFLFSGKNGITLSVNLEARKGYRFGKDGYWSHSFQSDKQSGVTLQPTSKDRPHIFQAYRLGQAAKLDTESLHQLLEVDCRVYSLSFDKKRIVPDGSGDIQIIVWQKRDAVDKKSSAWGVELKGRDTLLQETNDPFLYWAPSDGYGAAWSFSWSSADTAYNLSKTFSFWIKRGDTYGSLRIESDAFFKDGLMVGIRYALNTKQGERNLQPVLPDWTPEDVAAHK
jgi:hypothetical protein